MNATPATISPEALAARLRGENPVLVIDVRLEDDFERRHIAGAVSNCVFEVAFTDRLADTAPDKQRPVCLYGAGAGSHESRMAREKLERLGYAAVCELEGGIDAWAAQGYPVEGDGGEPSKPAAPPDGTLDADPGECRVRWTGRNLLNFHEGTIDLKSGTLRFANGGLAGGSFVIDMESIRCSDLAGDSLHDVLVNHLRDHDFFDTGEYPEARLEILSATDIEGARPGAPNLRIRADLTLKDVTAPLGFDACAGLTDDGRPAAQATFSFDRTLWNVLYGSGRWFHRLGGHLVNDLVEIQVRIVGKSPR
ncbi:MAG: YceI family protein [Akkermansiaceae bacterium]|nr:YceI family protein [Akkermansiaceae bacterium]MCP5548347.1 YceI family protein [Akkermansiaceae bacterium]